MSIQLKLQKSDFQIEVMIGEQKEVVDIRTALNINKEDLVLEYTKQPSWYAWYSSLLADQEDKKERRKIECEVARNKMDLELRQGKRKILDEEGKQIKLTEGGIQNYISNDEKIKVYVDEIQELEYISNKLKLLVQGSVQRKDMLIQLGMLKRQEMQQLGMIDGK